MPGHKRGGSEIETPVSPSHEVPRTTELHVHKDTIGLQKVEDWGVIRTAPLRAG